MVCKVVDQPTVYHADADLVLASADCCALLANTLTRWKCYLDQEQPEHWLQISQLTALTSLSLDSYMHDAIDSYTRTAILSLCELQHLPRLHELDTKYYHGLMLQDMPAKNLRHLFLKGVDGKVCNLQSCHCLTQLTIWTGSLDLQQLILPAGSEVQLQDLKLTSCGVAGILTFQVDNLEAALQLTHLELSGIYPKSLGKDDWPRNLPNLECLEVGHVSETLPANSFTNYPKLTYLHWAEVQGTLPDGFSQLTQLSGLDLRMATCGIPSAVMALSQLATLNLGCGHATTGMQQITEEIKCFANWPNLRYICLPSRTFEQCDLDAQLLLCQLRNQITQVNPDCEVYIDVCR